MINECLIQYEQKSYEKFIQNARILLFGDFLYVLEPDNINCMYKNAHFALFP